VSDWYRVNARDLPWPRSRDAYQAQLGLPQTGYVDPDMANLWDQAVETGRRYAMAGKQVELRFLFDQLVAATAAQGGLGGGGGGGGSAPSRESYYFWMMETLGDISGVGG
jgi:hypothetical protein